MDYHILNKTIFCKNCNLSFQCRSDKKYANTKFCSRKCYLEFQNKFGGKVCSLSQSQMDIFDGLMLSDGHLEPNVSNTSARMTFGFEYKETLYDIKNLFPNLHFSKPWESKSHCFHSKSSFYKTLSIERRRWYPDGTKIVPKDIRLTSLSCLWWFLGDGYQVDYGVKLCTDGFDDKSLEILISELQNCGVDCRICCPRDKSKNQYKRILIESTSSIKFLNWIKFRNNIPEQYLYKFGNHRRQCFKYAY